MDKSGYRIIFNKARGLLMAVTETSTASKNNHRPLTAAIKPLALFVWDVLGLGLTSTAYAQIVADPTAPANQRPTILTAPNNVPLVNIQTPSAAGVSRNTYRQFDVSQRGVILNNSRTNVQTQLGGWVPGNPWLAAGSARVILNEVNSNHPSLLRGPIETTLPAHVVIANPGGITCDGCGFINAHRATLTTGLPVMNNGNLEGYRVHGGQVTITGKGMDARSTDYTDVIARAVKMNAGIWAKQLKVVAGANQVSINQTTQDPSVSGTIAGTGTAPAFAIDTAQLGGMYAGKITLLATEAGVGVRNAGKMYAGVGDVIITANGQLQNAGHIIAKGNVTAKVDATLTNRGTLHGTETVLETQTLNNLGSGKIYGDHIATKATTVTNAAQNDMAPVIAAHVRLDIGADTIDNRGHAILFSGGEMAIGGSLDASTRATGQATTLNNDSATIEATVNMTINAQTINNTNQNFSTKIERLPVQNIAEYQGSGSPHRHTPGTPNVYVYNDESDHLHTPEGNYESWSFYNYTRHISETRVDRSDPAQITSGEAMHLIADTVNNDKSHIIAGGALTGTIGTLNNTEVAGERVTTDSGSVTSYWRDHRKGRDSTGSHSASYQPAPAIAEISLTPTVYQQNTAAGTTQTPITQVVASDPARAVRSGGINISVPNNSLFGLTPNPTAHYLIETDPKFANYRTWLSSDYLLNALSVDPALAQKRLGDGFYEQKLLREQVAQLTGRRFLNGYANDEAQYRALINHGVTFAKNHQLVPGVTLSAAQMAQLTSDIVWLVEKDITLPDGTKTKALVPQLYVRVQKGDLQSGGALIAGDNVKLNLTGNLENGGTIAGRQVVAITADNIHNLGGRLLGDDDVDVTARRDLNNIGGTIVANNHLAANAGRDLNVTSTTRTQTNTQGSQTNIARVAGLYVTGNTGTLLAHAGRDANLNAAVIQNQGSGDTTLTADHNVNLGTVTQSSSNRIVWNGNNQRSDSSQVDIGTHVQTQGKLRFSAGHDLNAKAANVKSSQGSLLATAGNDVNLTAGVAHEQVDEAHQHTGRSSAFSSKTITTRDTLDQTKAQATTFSGKTTTVLADHDINLKGSNVVSDNGTLLFAQNNLNTVAATNTTIEGHFRDEKKSGLFSGGGFGITIGTQQQSVDQQGVTKTAAPSTVGSTQGDIKLQAGRHYAQTGSDVIAAQGDIDIEAQRIDIVEARNTRQTQTETKFKQSGLTVAITSPVISAIQTAQQMHEAASDTTDPRMKALAAANIAFAGKNAADAIKAGQGTTINGKDHQIPTGKTHPDGTAETRDANAAEKAGGINLAISIGSSGSESKTNQTRDTARVSTVVAGGNINMTARGAGQDSSLTSQGSSVTAGNNIQLEAEHQVKLLAAQNTAAQHSTNKNTSANVGVSMGTDGILLTASASGGRGHADGSDITWTNTHVNAGNQVTMTSRDDTELKGALVIGKQVTAKVGRNLDIESPQDTSQFDSQQQNLGGSLALGYGKMGGSFNASTSQVDSDFASVAEQSGIRTGEDGFQVTVANNTDLKGGAITSTQQAIDDNKNHFSTGGTLTTSDIQNQAHYQASSVGVNLGTGMSLDGKLVPQGTSAGMGKDSGHASSTTQAAISGVAGNKDARTGDAQSGLQTLFDADKVQKEIQAQVQITQTFGREASKAIGDYAVAKQQEARALRTRAKQAADPKEAAQLTAQADQLDTDWGDLGKMRILAHTLIGGLTGKAAGAAGAGSAAISAPMFSDALNASGVDPMLQKILIAVASTTLGGVIGAESGASSAFNEVNNNYLLHHRFRDEESERHSLRQRQKAGSCDVLCQDRLKALDTLDAQRDEQLAPLIAACQKAGRNNCKGEAIAQHFAQANTVGAEAMKRESNAGTLGSPFSFNNCPRNDKGGCSYGPLQIAADTGLMEGFMQSLKKNPAAEAQQFHHALQTAGGVKAAQKREPAFLTTWMNLTAQDPQFIQYQIDLLINRNLYPVVKELKTAEIDFHRLPPAHKEALFSASVQHGSGVDAEKKGADNLLERTISVAQSNAKAPVFCSGDDCPPGSPRPLPTYTRRDLVYGEVESRWRESEHNQAKLIKQLDAFITQREGFITQREGFITQQRDLITQQRDLERKKSQLLGQGLGANSAQIKQIQQEIQPLDQQIRALTSKVQGMTREIEGITPKINGIAPKIEGATNKINAMTKDIQQQQRYMDEAAQYLKEQAKSAFGNGEQFIRDFYKIRTEMYPAEAERYRKEMDSLLKQYRQEQKGHAKQ